MARHVYLADLFRSGGLTVIEYDGWRTRGADRFNPGGIIEHDTVTPPSVSDARAAALLRDGRPDLAGPLSQWGTARDGVVHLVAAGRANHNGYGYGGNDRFGNECFNDGYGEPHTVEQERSNHIQAGLLCKYHGWPESAVLGHKESDPKRKIDPRTVWMPGFRAAVQEIITLRIGELTMADIAEIITRLDSIKNDTKTTADELFHFGEISDPVPQTGQRKSQFWQLLTGAAKVPEILRRQVLLEDQLAKILERLPAPPSEK